MLENIILFFVSYPLGFVVLLISLVYLEYLLGKNILKCNPGLLKFYHARIHDFIKYARVVKLKMAAFRAQPENLKPAIINIKKRRPRHKKR